MHVKLSLVTLVSFLAGTSAVLAQEVQTETFGLGSSWEEIIGALLGKQPVKKAELSDTLQKLYDAALANGGNRAFGLPGYDASVDLVLKKISKYDSKKAFKVWKQPFVGLWTQVTEHALIINDEEPITPNPLTYSPSTPAGGIQAELVIVPGDAKPCTSEELLATGVDVTDKILLIERGRCPDGTTFAGKVKTASGAGALAAIIYNSDNSTLSSGTLTNPNPAYVPSGILQRNQGLALRERVLNGETLIAHYSQTQLIENRTTVNVFAETKAGDASNVVMLGAHLDSVQAGAGINDDGSGTTLILELLRTLDAKHVRNKVRFAWWGAEENGLLGSKHYTETLSAKDVDNLLLYLNFDMVGHGYYGVFDGDGSTHNLTAPAGSDVIEKLFNDYFKTKKIVTTPAAFTGGSDYAHFMEDLDKPVGGLHTGTTGYDPCYHLALAAQDILRKLAAVGHKIIPKSKAVSRRTSTLGATAASVEWTELEGEGHTCGDEL